jgi:hypothetical protein
MVSGVKMPYFADESSTTPILADSAWVTLRSTAIQHLGDLDPSILGFTSPLMPI